MIQSGVHADEGVVAPGHEEPEEGDGEGGQQDEHDEQAAQTQQQPRDPWADDPTGGDSEWEEPSF